MRGFDIDIHNQSIYDALQNFENSYGIFQLETYSQGECAKKIIWCQKWVTKTVFFKDLEWFLANSMGLSKRKPISKP